MLLGAFDTVATDHDVTLGIIGDGPERDTLEAQRDKLSHATRIEFLGFLDDYEDVLGHMRAADEVIAEPTSASILPSTRSQSNSTPHWVAPAHPRHPPPTPSSTTGAQLPSRQKTRTSVRSTARGEPS